MEFTDYVPQPRFFNLGNPPIIGVNCSLVNTLFDCAAQIRIGNNVAFGHDCKVLTAKHDYTKRGAERLLISISKPITIEDGVWIASGVTILQGVTIGANSVIGAGSVVTKDIPANEMWLGIPARKLKDV